MNTTHTHGAVTNSAKEKYKDLRPTIHAPAVEQVVKQIWRTLLPTTEHMLARGRKAESKPFTSQDYGVRLSHTVES